MNPQLHILGYCEDMIPILVEIALDLNYGPSFRIVENMEVEKGRCRIDVPGAEYSYVQLTDWQPQGEEAVAFSVVQPASKQKVFDIFYQSCGLNRHQYANLIHPSSFVSRTAVLQQGLLLEPLSVISAHTAVGFGVTIRRGVNVGHHGSIGNFVSINPGVNIGGKVWIGDRCTLGIGAVVFDSVDIGADTIIGAGSVVTRSVPAGVVAYGNPCRVVRERV